MFGAEEGEPSASRGRRGERVALRSNASNAIAACEHLKIDRNVERRSSLGYNCGLAIARMSGHDAIAAFC